MTATRKPVTYRTQAAAREERIKEALRVVPGQTPGWHDLTIQQQVVLIRQYVEACENAAK